MRSRTINLPLAPALLAGLLSAGCPVFADGGSGPEIGGSGPEIEALREELRAMREEYEGRIAKLEARLEAALQTADDPAPAAAGPADAAAGYEALYAPSPQTVSVARDSAFNPAIGVTFQGQAWSASRSRGRPGPTSRIPRPGRFPDSRWAAKRGRRRRDCRWPRPRYRSPPT
jgi:hypothetical protein